MSLVFILSVAGLILILPLYYLSLEHRRLESWWGSRRAVTMGALFGRISGWGFFLFWAGLWGAPQPRFQIITAESPLLTIPLGAGIPVVLSHLILSLPLMAAAFYLGLKGVKDLGLEAAETHRSEEVCSRGIYARLRHPQYAGGLAAHLAFTFLLSGLHSLLAFPPMILYVILLCRMEERAMVREFGAEYEEYRRRVPMLIPRLKRHGDE